MKELYRFKQFLTEGAIKEEKYSGAIIRKGSSDKAKEDTKIVRQALKKASIKFTNRGEFGMNFKDADLAQIKKVIAGEKVGEFVVSRDVNEDVIRENEEPKSKYYRLGFHFGPNRTLKINSEMPEVKDILNTADVLYNQGIALKDLESGPTVEFTMGYIDSIRSRGSKYNGVLDVIKTLLWVRKQGIPQYNDEYWADREELE